MRLAGQIMLACLLLCAIQAVLTIMAIGLVLLLVWALFAHPRETIGLVAFLLFLEALFVHPFVSIGVIAILASLVWIARMMEAESPTPQPPVALLPPPAERTD